MFYLLNLVLSPLLCKYNKFSHMQHKSVCLNYCISLSLFKIITTSQVERNQ